METGLEAAIRANCDDPEPYLVYADWLQSRGDIRGTLIALHDAVRRDPQNREAVRTASALLDDARSELLGPLARRNDVELTWYQGFATAIHIRYFAWAQLRDALLAILTSPACAFVQRITIDSAEQAERVVRLLTEHGEPRTLCHIAMGKPSEWSPPSELVDTFPRLAGDPVVEWEQALAAARKLRHQVPELELPVLVMRAGMPAGDPRMIVRGIKAEIADAKPLGLLRALPRACTRESLDHFVLMLAQREPAMWAFDAIGMLGGDACVAWLGDRFDTLPQPRALRALDHLRTIGSDAAGAELARLALFTTRAASTRSRAAAEALDMFALARDVDSLAQLVARACPRTNPRYGAMQVRWLEDLMVAGDRLHATDFLTHVVDHPLRRGLARSLVWGVFAGSALTATFRPTPSGLVDRQGRPFDLALDAKVGVVHPTELDEPWQIEIDDQPFPQLARPTYGATEQVPNVRVERLLTRGWSNMDGTIARRYRRDNALVRASTWSDGVRICFHRGHDWIDRPLAELHPVSASEVLRDLHAVARRRDRR